MTKLIPPAEKTRSLNDDRAAWAGLAMQAFVNATGSEPEDCLCDLLCDLMHWADRNDRDFDAASCRASHHYSAEVIEDA